MSGRMFTALFIALTILTAPTSSSAQTASPAEAHAIAKDAYVYSYAMIESYQTRRKGRDDRSMEAAAAGGR